MKTQTERTLENRIAAREHVHAQMEDLLRELDGKMPDETQDGVLKRHRGDLAKYDDEILILSEQVDADREAAKKSEAIRRAAQAAAGVADADEGGIIYRTMAEYARDVILTGQGREVSKISAQVGNDVVRMARERLELIKRTPAATLSSNVGGLIPDQHIAQIFQVIDSSRPLVASAQRTTLERGQLSYPSVDTRPVVAVQSTEKTEAGNQGMAVSMQTATASTYLGGGNLSWQAINWSTPDALELWFRLAAADYALKTEADAAETLEQSAFLYNISSTLNALTDFSDVMAAIAAGAGDVYTNSGRLADTVYMDPTAFYSVAAIAGTEAANFLAAGALSLRAQDGVIAGLNVVVSRGMDAGVIVVGDSDGLLVAETGGAPVELRVVEPAIGGVEVGIIGAFEAVVVDPGAFALITTAS
jgi:hypothetical protein